MPTRTIAQIETNQLSTLLPALVEVGREVPLAALLLMLEIVARILFH
jgi:hypothetical protein